MKEIVEITEGNTKILVPPDSIKKKVPPRTPAFFNPRAQLNRDFSIVAFSAFWKNFKGPKIFLDGLSGIGARSLRVANEINGVEKVIANDANPIALQLSLKSAKLNNLNNFEISENEVCHFLNSFSVMGKRGSIVDIDPFGSPAKYIDCAIRATLHGGMLAITATDLQVLHGLFEDACKRRYYGVPIKTEYSNEIAIRLILGCMRMVASRLDIQIIPLFVENEMHYYRTYVRVLNRSDQAKNIGYIVHCKSCGNRALSIELKDQCYVCESDTELAGPLWIGQLFDKEFVQCMMVEAPRHIVDKKCEKLLYKCAQECQMPGTYFTLDEIASKMKVSPLKLEKTISRLQSDGFVASPTSLNPTGFRTNATIEQIFKIFRD